MKIHANTNVIAPPRTPQIAGAAKQAEAEPGEFERLLDEASKSKPPMNDAPTADEAEGEALAQNAASNEGDAQDLPEASEDEVTEDPVEIGVIAEIDQPIEVPVTVVAVPVAVADAAAHTAGAAEVATSIATREETAGPGESRLFASQGADAALAAAEVKAEVGHALQADGAQQTAPGKEDAKPPAAGVSAKESAQLEVVVQDAAYKPVVSAKQQAGEKADVNTDTAAVTTPSPEVGAAAEGEIQQQGQRDSGEKHQAPTEFGGTAKPQAIEEGETPQSFIAPPAGMRVETAEVLASSGIAEASPSAAAGAPSEAPRPTAPPSAAAAQQTLHAQRQESDDHRVAEQAMRAVRSIVNQRGGSLTLRLNPPELGDLRIRLEMTQHGVSARIEASSDAVRQLLQQQLPQLHSALSSHGLTVDQIQVQTQPSAGQQQSQEHESHGEGRSRGGFDRQQQRGEQPRDEPDNLSRFQRELLDLVA